MRRATHRAALVLTAICGFLVAAGCGSSSWSKENETGAILCANQRDDDHDGLTDCRDPGCRRTDICDPGGEDAETDGGADGGTNATTQVVRGAPKKVILFIGDGMGTGQVEAAGIYAHGAAGTLSFESFPYRTEISVHSASNSLTDSAASTTAMAAGRKVDNGVVAKAVPGDEHDLETLFDIYQARGAAVGLVTNTFATHATPAAFAAHALSRYNYELIAWHYFNSTLPDLLFGGGGYHVTPEAAAIAGYTIVENSAELSALVPAEGLMVSGQFGAGHMPYVLDGLGDLPHLSQMAVRALEILSLDPDGFFLVVEGGRIDHAGHSNDLARLIPEVLALDATVSALVGLVDDWEQTLVIVTADHETGGLEVTANNGAGNLPDVTWSSTVHSAAQVPLFARGALAEELAAIGDNTQLFDVLSRRP